MKHRLSRQMDLARTAVVATVALLGLGTWAIARRRRLPRLASKRRPDMPSLAGGHGLRVERAVTIMRSPDELYSRWRDLSRLPEVMPYLESVTPLDATHSRWVARGPGDMRVSWEAEVVADEPGRLIAWRSTPGSEVDIAGSVRFTAGQRDRGTEVKVLVSYAPPAGRLGDALAALFGRGGDREVRESLRRFKQQMETDEIAIAARRRPKNGADAGERRFEES